MVFKKARITRIIVELDDLLGDFKAKIGVILALVPLLFQFYMLLGVSVVVGKIVFVEIEKNAISFF